MSVKKRFWIQMSEFGDLWMTRSYSGRIGCSLSDFLRIFEDCEESSVALTDRRRWPAESEEHLQRAESSSATVKGTERGDRRSYQTRNVSTLNAVPGSRMWVLSWPPSSLLPPPLYPPTDRGWRGPPPALLPSKMVDRLRGEYKKKQKNKSCVWIDFALRCSARNCTMMNKKMKTDKVMAIHFNLKQ